MKDNSDPLARAIENLKDQQVPDGPPQAVVDSTIQTLAEAAHQNKSLEPRRLSLLEKIRNTDNIIKLTTKVAAAAAVLVLAGYAIGRFSAPKPPDIRQLRDDLEQSLAARLIPAIRQDLLEETNRRLQFALAQTSAELTEQYRGDLNRFAVQTLMASNTVTNHLLTQLIQSINATQTQDLRRVAAALNQIEINRLKDKTQLATGIQTLAYQTEDEFVRTKQDVARLLVSAKDAGPGPDAYESPTTPNERIKE
jgi:hypothetical protein